MGNSYYNRVTIAVVIIFVILLSLSIALGVNIAIELYKKKKHQEENEADLKIIKKILENNADILDQKTVDEYKIKIGTLWSQLGVFSIPNDELHEKIKQLSFDLNLEIITALHKKQN